MLGPSYRRCRCRSIRHLLQISIVLLTLHGVTEAIAQNGIVEDLSTMVRSSANNSMPVWPVSEGSVHLADSSNGAIIATPSTTLGVTQLGSEQDDPPVQSISPQWTKFDKVVIAHAVVGSIAWMVISPTIVIVARASTFSFRTCTIAQSFLTGSLTLVAVVLGCTATNISPSSSHFESSHQQMGLVLMILLLLQLVLGRVIGYSRSIDFRTRRISDYVHTVFSVGLSAIGFAQIWLGMELYEQKSGRKTPLAAKIIWAIIVALFSILLTTLAIRRQFGTDSEPLLSMKEKLRLNKRKATVRSNKNTERGIRSDGLWIGVLGENTSGTTFISSYTDATVFSEASQDPGVTFSERKTAYSLDSLNIPAIWLSDLEKHLPADPSTLPVYQADQSYSNRAPASSAELSLPLTCVSPLVPILEEEAEEEEMEDFEKEHRLEASDDTRHISWNSSSAASVDTAWSDLPSQSRSSRTKSIKRKPAPRS